MDVSVLEVPSGAYEREDIRVQHEDVEQLLPEAGDLDYTETITIDVII